MSTLAAIDTRADLVEWLTANMPGASVHDLEGELIIHTGLTWEMNGELMPIEGLSDTCPDEGDIPLTYCTCKEEASE